MHPRARARTRSGLKTTAFCLAAVAAGVCLAACDTGYKFSTSGNQAPGSGSPSGTGSTSSTAQPQTAPPCTARDLVAKGGRRQDANDAGGAIGDVVVSDPTTAACELRGAPSIGLVKVGGAALDVSAVSAPGPALPAVVVEPRMKSAAELVFTWQNWCGPSPGTLEMRISLPDGQGTFTAPLNGELGTYVPTCGRPGTPSVLRVEYAWVNAGGSKLASA
jgi:hypothetical protein